jgi:multisubunit Na+/H+ antiporter MnhC subunit
MVFGLMWFDTVLEGHYQLTTLMLVGALFYIGVYLVMARLMVKLGVVALVHYSYCTLIVSAYDSSILAMADQHPPIHGVFVIE